MGGVFALKLLGRVATACAIAMLLTIALPFAMVRLDWISARWLGLVPSALAVEIAAALAFTLYRSRRRAPPQAPEEAP